MIFTSLQRAWSYESLGKRFRAGFEWLRTTDLVTCPPGRHSVDGDDVYALVQENMTKPAANCRWEAHRRFADIQYVISGVEGMGCAPTEGFAVETPYEDTSDVGFFRGEGRGTISSVAAGQFALFLPSDVHMPLIAVGSPMLVKKVVVKVRV